MSEYCRTCGLHISEDETDLCADCGIKYVVGDATQPIGDGPKIIVHIVNDIGAWGSGFVLALSSRWSTPEQSYRSWWSRSDVPFNLGEVQIVKVEDEIGRAHV